MAAISPPWETSTFRDVPRGCHCDWTARASDRYSTWVLTRVHPSCHMHVAQSPAVPTTEEDECPAPQTPGS